jgi:hypothetical protein
MRLWSAVGQQAAGAVERLDQGHRDVVDRLQARRLTSPSM